MTRMKRLAAVGSALILAAGGVVAAQNAWADPVKPGAVLVQDQHKPPAQTPGQLLAAGKLKLSDLKPSTQAKQKVNKLGGQITKGVPGQKPSAKTGGGIGALTACATICYLYNGGRQDIAGTLGSNIRGTSALVKVGGHQGALNGATDYHTLGEISVQGPGTNGPNIVEVGWTVDPRVNKPGGVSSYKPHLFTFAWVDGTGLCYNLGCGFIQYAGAPINPGDQLTSASSYTMAIYHETTPSIAGWWIYAGTDWAGYWPDSLWTGASTPQTFADSDFTQLFGEIASTEQEPCSDMGLGTVGSNANAARFGSTQYYNSSGSLFTTGVNLNTFRQAVGAPDANASSPYANTFGEGPAGSQRAFRYGGPMWNAAGTGVGSVGQPC